jgi:hypothetical protein
LVLGAPWQKSARNQAFFLPPLRIFANFCFLLHFCTSNFGHFGVNSQFFFFPQKPALFGKKFGEFGLKTK